MATVTAHLNASGGLRRNVFVLVAVGIAATLASRSGNGHAAGASPAAAQVIAQAWSLGSVTSRASYGWPLKPFNRPHAVRAYFNDPRISDDGASKTFHFGIDIAVSERTPLPVYAVESGRVRLANRFALMLWSTRTFAYWHVVPVVRDRQLVQKHQLIAMSIKGWNHVHFGEYYRGSYLNPLRPGALGPYRDATIPRVQKISFLRNRRDLGSSRVSGTCSIVLAAFDTAPSVRPAPWPVSPALIRWRVLRGGRQVTRWRTAIDSRGAIRGGSFGAVYAPGTKQNHPGRPGQYRYYLAHGWSSKTLPDAAYAIEIRVSDAHKNMVVARMRLTIDNV